MTLLATKNTVTCHQYHWILNTSYDSNNLCFRFPLDPLPYKIHFSGIGEVESADLQIKKKKRACVIANINAEESSALFRQFIDFCPENTTIRIELVRNTVYGTLKCDRDRSHVTHADLRIA